jgi:hypothetical protein
LNQPPSLPPKIEAINTCEAAVNRYKRPFRFGRVQVKDKIWRPFILSILSQYEDLNTSENSIPIHSSSASKSEIDSALKSLHTEGFISRKLI